MSRVLLTGGGGVLGRAIVSALRSAGHEALPIGHLDLDVTDRAATQRATRRLAPRAVIDTALPADVDTVAAGAENLAAAAATVDAFLVYVSCADVFVGISGPYDEAHRPAPATRLGEAKLAAERAVADATLNHAIVRTSWLYGAGRESALLAPLQEPGATVAGDVTVTGSPTYIPHLADILVALVRRPVHGVFHRAGSGSCTQLEFLRAAMRVTRTPRRPVVESASLDAPPRDYSLTSVRNEVPVLPDWRLGLQTHLEARETRTSPDSGPAPPQPG